MILHHCQCNSLKLIGLAELNRKGLQDGPTSLQLKCSCCVRLRLKRGRVSVLGKCGKLSECGEGMGLLTLGAGR